MNEATLVPQHILWIVLFRLVLQQTRLKLSKPAKNIFLWLWSLLTKDHTCQEHTLPQQQDYTVCLARTSLLERAVDMNHEETGSQFGKQAKCLYTYWWCCFACNCSSRAVLGCKNSNKKSLSSWQVFPWVCLHVLAIQVNVLAWSMLLLPSTHTKYSQTCLQVRKLAVYKWWH